MFQWLRGIVAPVWGFVGEAHRGVKRVSMPNTNNGGTGSVLFGTREQVGVGRGLAEFRAGRPVGVTSGDETLLCLPVEGLNKERLVAFRALCAPIAPRLVLTSLRARSLGINANERSEG